MDFNESINKFNEQKTPNDVYKLFRITSEMIAGLLSRSAQHQGKYLIHTWKLIALPMLQ